VGFTDAGGRPWPGRRCRGLAPARPRPLERRDRVRAVAGRGDREDPFQPGARQAALATGCRRWCWRTSAVSWRAARATR